jgi:multidrug efflux pump
VADTVAAPIEQKVVGVEGMLYMSSQSNNDGSYTLDVTFALGTDVNMAQVLDGGLHSHGAAVLRYRRRC